MTVDIISLIVLAVMAYLGWRSGAVRQIVRIIAIIAVIVGVPFLSPIIRRVAFGESGLASPGIEVGSIVMAGVAIYVGVSVVGWMVVKTMRFVSRTLSLFDRAAGTSIGALKGLVLVYLVAVLVVMVEGPLAERDPDDRMALRSGKLVSFAGEHNLLAPWQFPDLEELHRALRLGQQVEEIGAHAQVREHPNIAEFLRDERVQALLLDDELMGWVGADRYPLTLADRRVRRILNDEALMQRLDDADWDKIKDELEGQAR